MIGTSKTYTRNNILFILTCALALFLIIGWVLYGLFGYYVIETLYSSDSLAAIFSIFENRDTIPLKYYHQAADRLMVISTYRFILAFIVLVILIKNPIGLILACFSILFCFSFIFITLEIFPNLINSLRFDAIDYYAYNANYLADDKLAYREKPLLKNTIHNFRGTRYSPIFHIDVEPMTVEWATDQHGFRNSYTPQSADMVVVGDSFLEWGANEADIFPKRLEKHLPGISVYNLGKAGYGPFQYLEVLQRYGLNKNPQYTLFCFYEGNDISDITNYLLWIKEHNKGNYGVIYAALTSGLLQRYIMALNGVINFIRGSVSLVGGYAVSKVWEARGYVNPELVVLSLGEKTYKTTFRYRHVPPMGKLLRKEEVIKLKEILEKFRAIAKENNIIPVILYIPTNTHIYAEYSTPDSGITWIKQRSEALDARKNIERIVEKFSEDLNIEFISLVPIFEKVARDGVMVFELLDSHWNAAGREVAAQFVSDRLKSKVLRNSPPASH